MTAPITSPPNWDPEQLAVITEPNDSYQLVEAGPGSGKSAVACQRIAFLIEEGISPSRILLLCFTRAAVAELRDRIISYAAAGTHAMGVRIATIDSHAWSLRTGFDVTGQSSALGEASFEQSIARTIEMFEEGDAELLDFMSGLEHLIIDEAQDVLGSRAELVMCMLESLSADCGVTILADSAQAIYGFTSDERESEQNGDDLLTRLSTWTSRALIRRALKRNHRVKEPALANLFVRARSAAQTNSTGIGHVSRVQKAIRDSCAGDLGEKSYEEIPGVLVSHPGNSTFALFRRRADALIASSYCSGAGLEHRLRLSHLPTVVYPWIGWLFGEYAGSFISETEFNELWQFRTNAVSSPFEGRSRDECWQKLHHLAAGHLPRAIDLERLRLLVARPRPPIELCAPDVGRTGPILGTIHSAKGREADTVVLVMSPPDEELEEGQELEKDFEEGRVYYVGATRARKTLVTTLNSSKGVGYLESGRPYRTFRPLRAQLEVGRNGDLDPFAALSWDNALDVQRCLASCVGRSIAIRARALKQNNYSFRLELDGKSEAGASRSLEFGQLSEEFMRDWRQLWRHMGGARKVHTPSLIPYLYVVDVTTVGVPESQRGVVKQPFNSSALALAPVIKGLPIVQYFPANNK